MNELDFATQILSTAKSYGAFHDMDVAFEYARNVLNHAPSEFALEAFLALCGKSFPRPNEVIQRAKEMAGDKKRLAPLQRFACIAFTSTNDREYEAVREISTSQHAVESVRVGERFIGSLEFGGDNYSRWRSEYQAMSPDERALTERAKLRFYEALRAVCAAHGMPGPRKTDKLSASEERNYIGSIEAE